MEVSLGREFGWGAEHWILFPTDRTFLTRQSGPLETGTRAGTPSWGSTTVPGLVNRPWEGHRGREAGPVHQPRGLGGQGWKKVEPPTVFSFLKYSRCVGGVSGPCLRHLQPHPGVGLRVCLSLRVSVCVRVPSVCLVTPAVSVSVSDVALQKKKLQPQKHSLQ